MLVIEELVVPLIVGPLTIEVPVVPLLIIEARDVPIIAELLIIEKPVAQLPTIVAIEEDVKVALDLAPPIHCCSAVLYIRLPNTNHA